MIREHEIKQKKCPKNGMQNCIGKECVAWNPLRDKDWVDVVFISKVMAGLENEMATYTVHESDIEIAKRITNRHERVQTYGGSFVNFGTHKVELVINETWAVLADFEDGMEIGECSLMSRGEK